MTYVGSMSSKCRLSGQRSDTQNTIDVDQMASPIQRQTIGVLTTTHVDFFMRIWRPPATFQLTSGARVATEQLPSPRGQRLFLLGRPESTDFHRTVEAGVERQLGLSLRHS